MTALPALSHAGRPGAALQRRARLPLFAALLLLLAALLALSALAPPAAHAQTPVAPAKLTIWPETQEGWAVEDVNVMAESEDGQTVVHGRIAHEELVTLELPPGRYRVLVGGAGPAGAELDPEFVPTWFPAATQKQDAAILDLQSGMDELLEPVLMRPGGRGAVIVELGLQGRASGVAGSWVYLLGPHEEIVQRRQTDARGVAYFRSIPAGRTYVIRAEERGYATEWWDDATSFQAATPVFLESQGAVYRPMFLVAGDGPYTPVSGPHNGLPGGGTANPGDGTNGIPRPPTTLTPPPLAPALVDPGGVLTANANGAVRLAMLCQVGRRCQGTVSLSTQIVKKKGKKRTKATLPITVAVPSSGAPVTLQLTPRGRLLLKKAGKKGLVVALTITGPGPTDVTRSNVRLKLKTKKKAKKKR